MNMICHIATSCRLNYNRLHLLNITLHISTRFKMIYSLNSILIPKCQTCILINIMFINCNLSIGLIAQMISTQPKVSDLTSRGEPVGGPQLTVLTSPSPKFFFQIFSSSALICTSIDQLTTSGSWTPDLFLNYLIGAK